MTTSDRSRVQSGVPTGGQFAVGARPEVDVTLASTPPVEISRGVIEVLDTAREEIPDDEGKGNGRIAIHMGGIPHVRAAAKTAGLHLERSSTTQAEDQLAALAAEGAKASVLIQSQTGDVHVREGTLHLGDDGDVALLTKGSRTRGTYLAKRSWGSGGPRVLAVEPGFGHANALADTYRDHADQVPRVGPATFDGIPVVDDAGDPPSDIAAVYVFEHPGFDGSQDGRGSVFFVTDIQPGDGSSERWGRGVVNGYGVYSPGSGLESEHGSMYVRDLERHGGRVEGYQSGALTFSDAIDLGNKASAYGAGDIEATWSAVRDAAR